jgi:hypothetical protein
MVVTGAAIEDGLSSLASIDLLPSFRQDVRPRSGEVAEFPRALHAFLGQVDQMCVDRDRFEVLRVCLSA